MMQRRVKHEKFFKFGCSNYGQLETSEDILFPKQFTFFKPYEIKDISLGIFHTLFLTTDHKVYGVGCNVFGQLGIGNLQNQFTITKISFFDDKCVESISAGRFYSLFLTRDGKIYGVGDGRMGQLTSLAIDTISIPILISNYGVLKDEKFIKIAAGDQHSLFLNDKGEVFGCGSNLSKQLGRQTEEQCDDPVKLECLSNYRIIDIGCGGSHSVFMTSLNEILVLGKGESILSYEIVDTPKRILKEYDIVKFTIGEFYNIFLTRSGSAFIFGKHYLLQFDYEPISFDHDPIIDAGTGQGHVVLLTKNGKMYTAGDYNGRTENANIFGLAKGLEDENIVSIFVGGRHTFCASGTVSYIFDYLLEKLSNSYKCGYYSDVLFKYIEL